MTGLLICAAVAVAVWGWLASIVCGAGMVWGDRWICLAGMFLGLALIAVALWLAYAAGGVE